MIAPDESGLDPRSLAAVIPAMETAVADVDGVHNGHWFEVRANGTHGGLRRGPCHGSMRGEGFELIGTLSPWGRVRYQSYLTYAKDAFKKPLDVELLTRFYDWFVNRSWAASYVVAPSLAYARDVGIVVSTDIPANYLLAVITMSRNAGEQAHNVVRMFSYVDELGVSEDLAYFAAFGMPTENRFGQIIGGHNLFYGQGADALDNWMRRDIKETNASFRSGGSTRGVNAMWGPSSRNVAESYERFNKAKAETGAVVIPNPFKPVVPASYRALTEDYVQSIMPNIEEFYRNDRIRQAA